MNAEDRRDTLIDQLYFVISYHDLKRQLNWDEHYDDELLELLKIGWVDQLRYDKKNGDFVKQHVIDSSFENYSYLASKKGLLAHNGF